MVHVVLSPLGVRQPARPRADKPEAMKQYDPMVHGYQWADEDGPRFRMEPNGYRGYIEGRPVGEVNDCVTGLNQT